MKDAPEMFLEPEEQEICCEIVKKTGHKIEGCGRRGGFPRSCGKERKKHKPLPNP